MLVVLCGCFHPTTAFDVPCSTSGACPDNQVCDPSRSPPTCVAALADASAQQIDAPVSELDAPVDDARPDGMMPKPDAATDAPMVMIDAPPPIPILYVQSNTTKPTSAVTTLTLPDAVASHDAIIVCLNYPVGPTLTSITDSAGNTYDVVVGPINANSTSHYVAIALDVTGATSDTLTLTLSAATGGGSDWFALEYSGLAHANAFDVTDNASGMGTAMTSGAATTTFGHELILGYAEASSATPGTNFTMRATQSGNMVEDRTAASTGSFTATATNTSGNWTMILATFRGF